MLAGKQDGLEVVDRLPWKSGKIERKSKRQAVSARMYTPEQRTPAAMVPGADWISTGLRNCRPTTYNTSSVLAIPNEMLGAALLPAGTGPV